VGVKPGRPAGAAATECGALARAGDSFVLQYLRRLPHPREKVWRALTEDEHLAGWFPTTMEGDRAAGAPLRSSFRESEGDPSTPRCSCSNRLR
jgi:Activator of Hsp90 ATPase homolog 1-like protein